MVRKKPKKKKTTKAKKKKEERLRNKIKPLTVIFVDIDGSTVRFERVQSEILFYLDGELTQRYVQILKVTEKGWVVFKGTKTKSDGLVFTLEVKTVVEIKPENKEKILLEMRRFRHWNGPLQQNSTGIFNGVSGTLSRFDSQKGCWQLSTASGQVLDAARNEIQLITSIFPHNCSRLETDVFGFRETPQQGIAMYAKEDIAPKRVLLKDRAFLFSNWKRGDVVGEVGEENLTNTAHLCHTLLTQHQSTVWSFLETTLTNSGETSVGSFTEVGETLRQILLSKDKMYSDESYAKTLTNMLAILVGNAFGMKFNGAPVSIFFPTITACNHHCDPNCQVEFGENQTGFFACLRTLRPIQKGDELTISYFQPDVLKNAGADRQTVIRDSRRFECLCSSCV